MQNYVVNNNIIYKNDGSSTVFVYTGKTLSNYASYFYEIGGSSNITIATPIDVSMDKYCNNLLYSLTIPLKVNDWITITNSDTVHVYIKVNNNTVAEHVYPFQQCYLNSFNVRGIVKCLTTIKRFTVTYETTIPCNYHQGYDDNTVYTYQNTIIII